MGTYGLICILFNTSSLGGQSELSKMIAKPPWIVWNTGYILKIISFTRWPFLKNAASIFVFLLISMHTKMTYIYLQPGLLAPSVRRIIMQVHKLLSFILRWRYVHQIFIAIQTVSAVQKPNQKPFINSQNTFIG